MSLGTNFRNAGGQLVKGGHTQYSDIKTSATNRDNYMGSSNNEVYALTNLSSGLLLLPISNGTNQQRILPSYHPCNLVPGRPVIAVDFNPFDKTMFVCLAEDKSSSPASVLIYGGRYKAENINDIQKLNADVELLFSYEMCHDKRPVDIKFNRFVKDLLYSAGNTEICAYRVLYGSDEVELDQLGMFAYDDNSFIMDMNVSSDGKYLGASYSATTSNGSETILAIYSTSSQTLLGSKEEVIEPLTAVSVGVTQKTKISMLKDGQIAIGKLSSGRRQLSLYQYNESNNTLTHVSNADLGGTSPVQLTHTNWENVFFTYGRGDTKVEMFVVDNRQIVYLGSYSSSKTILGVFFFDETYVNPQNYEIIRFMLATGSARSSKLEMVAFTLPRSGSFETSTIYNPMIYDEPSILFEDYEKNKPMTLKTIHPVQDFNTLMELNKLGGKKGMAKSSMKFSKTFAKSSQKITPAPAQSNSSQKITPAPAQSNSSQKFTPAAQTKPALAPQYSSQSENTPVDSEAVGQPLSVAPSATRKVGVTHQDLMDVLAELDKAHKRIDALENTVNGLREEINLMNQANDLEISDSME